jgi:predicted O-methyltransferase YrrM
MAQELWSDVDRYFVDALIPADPALDAALRASEVAGLPAIQVAPNQGRLLELIARIAGAQSILEIGTLGGYSTIWLAKALPAGGKLVSLELDPHHAEVARANVARAGFASSVEIITGRAVESLERLVREGHAPFDFVFIDADKGSYSEYLQWSLKLSHPGTVIVADNVVRGGKVIDPATEDANVKGVRTLIPMVAAEPRLQATAIQTVGSKGYDGFLFALVGDEVLSTK